MILDSGETGEIVYVQDVSVDYYIKQSLYLSFMVQRTYTARNRPAVYFWQVFYTAPFISN